MIKAGEGHDFINLTSSQFNFNDVLIEGESGHDILWSHTGNDTLQGGVGNDSLHGGSGIDRLEGNDGADTLNGGDNDSADILIGGLGADRFVFDEFQASTDIGNRDIIQDFNPGEDVIDVSELGFNTTPFLTLNGATSLESGMDTSSFLSVYYNHSNRFFGHYDAQTNRTHVQIDESNFGFTLLGEHTLTVHDFVWS